MTLERREYQRLHLTRPLDAWFGDFAVRLLDVSATGGRIETDEDPATGARALLRFFWRGQEVEIMAETVRTGEGDAGLRFVESSDLLRQLIADSAAELLRAQEANATGDRTHNVIGDETLTAASAGAGAIPTRFFVFTYDEATGWRRTAALIADQPENGFTVSAAEQPAQIDELKRSYESGDAEARRLIRMLAELSVGGSSPRPSPAPRSG